MGKNLEHGIQSEKVSFRLYPQHAEAGRYVEEEEKINRPLDLLAFAYSSWQSFLEHSL